MTQVKLEKKLSVISKATELNSVKETKFAKSIVELLLERVKKTALLKTSQKVNPQG